MASDEEITEECKVIKPVKIKNKKSKPKPEPAFGFTRFGKYSSPNPILVGRYAKKEKILSPEFAYYDEKAVGKYKPRALILPRRNDLSHGGDAGFKNVTGLTRFGKPCILSAIIRGRPIINIKRTPGPGAYDTDTCDECRIGISMKPRWAGTEITVDNLIPAPNKYELPCYIGTGPAYSLIPRRPLTTETCSPGPIYKLRPIRRPAQSMTFKAFPLSSGSDDDPGPGQYDIDSCMKQAFPSFPKVKFGKGYCKRCKHVDTNSGGDGPGPASVNLRESIRIGPRPSNPIIIPRREEKVETGTTHLVNLAGMTRFGPPARKKVLLISRYADKEDKNIQPHPDPFLSFMNPATRKIGIQLKSRRKDLKLGNINPGPAKYTLPQCFGSGPAFSMTHRRWPTGSHTLTRPAKVLEKITECKGNAPVSDKTDRKARPPEPPKNVDCVFDLIPYFEKLCLQY